MAARCAAASARRDRPQAVGCRHEQRRCAGTGEAALTRRFLLDFPFEAARLLEAMPAADAADAGGRAAAPTPLCRAWQALASDVAAGVLGTCCRPTQAGHLLAEAEPVASVAALSQLAAPQRQAWLDRLQPEDGARTARAAGLPGRLRRAPDGSARQPAARWHDGGARRSSGCADSAAAACASCSSSTTRPARRPREVQDLALAERTLPLAAITRGVVAVVGDLDPREEVVETAAVASDHDAAGVDVRPAASSASSARPR